MLLVALWTSAVADEEAAEQWERKLHGLTELIENSSVSKQILNSQNEASLQKYKLARSQREQADKAYRAGKFEESEGLIVKAKKTLFEAAKLSRPHDSRKDKEKSSYETMKRSMNALLEALHRIVEEKGKNRQVDTVVEGSKNQILQSDKLAASGQYKEAAVLLGKALHSVDSAINTLRSGDTLTRSLSFATPQDEYKYELERNDTHMMLINVYLAEKPVEKEVRVKVDERLMGARSFRQKAEELAAKDMFQDAIREMEASTVNIIRAIRDLGVYIPG